MTFRELGLSDEVLNAVADAGYEHPTPIQGDWKVDAVGLPKDVLKKFYVTNAEKLIFNGKRPQPYGKAP